MTDADDGEITYRWSLRDIERVPRAGLQVASTFSCGGGSSMGYKLAGFDVVAANDIDPVMARHYQKNLHPPSYYLGPVIDLSTTSEWDRFEGIDLLDGSPPCSTFSLSGKREETWGIQKKFREGQAVQVLSDLFFDFLRVVDRLRPRTVIAENVKGMLVGNAIGYTKLVMEGLVAIGYRPQLFLVNAADCGVPQRRERVFFAACREDIQRPPLRFAPKHRWISVQEAIDDLAEVGEAWWASRGDFKRDGLADSTWHRTLPGRSFAHTLKARSNNESAFTHIRLDPSLPSPTLQATGKHTVYHWSRPRFLCIEEYARLGSFPSDYEFESQHIGGYMVGMSVPPLMTRAIARAVRDQWLLP